MDFCDSIQDSDSDTCWYLTSFLLLSIQFQGAGYGKELSCLDGNGFYFLILPVYYPSRVFDIWQGTDVDCLDLILSIRLTNQVLPYSLQLFGC